MMNNGSEEAPAEALPPPPPPPPAVLMPASADPLAQHERDLSSREEELQRRVSWLLERNKAALAQAEGELDLLRRDLRMASQPKRAAMEHMRCRIEEASETVRVTRDARVAAAAVLAKADEAAVAAEAHKACLVRDLNALILQSSVQQFKHLESLQERMDSLSVRVGGEAARKPSAAQTFAAPSSPGAASTPAASSAYKAARAEMEAAAAVTNSLAEAERATEAAAEAAVAARAKQAEAERWQAAARAAHVQLPARPQARASATGPRLIGTLPPAPPPPPGALPPAPSPPGRHNTSPFLPPARAAPAAVAQFAGFDS